MTNHGSETAPAEPEVASEPAPKPGARPLELMGFLGLLALLAAAAAASWASVAMQDDVIA